MCGERAERGATAVGVAVPKGFAAGEDQLLLCSLWLQANQGAENAAATSHTLCSLNVADVLAKDR